MIGIIIAVFFFALLAKAIFETIWGTCIILQGLFWLTVAFFLDALAFILRLPRKIIGLFRKPQPKPAGRNMGTAIALHFGSIK